MEITMTDTLPLAWIIEPKKDGALPFLTHKPEVADKRKKAGDYVTPYRSQKPAPGNQEEL
jgi:hypothetical protein